jgi:hypothetical protein
MATTYLDPTGDQSHQWWALDLCTVCGSAHDPKGCFCRYCPSCSSFWKAETRADSMDGRAGRQLCPDCSDETNEIVERIQGAGI